MEESSNPNFIRDNYIHINSQRPSWSTYDPSLCAGSQFLIKFTFSCFSHYTEWVESEEYPPFPHLLSHESCPQANKSVVINVLPFLDNQECCQIMLLELRDLPLTNAQREKLMLSAWKQARKDLDSISRNHNVLNLHLRVDVVHRHVIRREDQDLIMSWIMQESVETAVEMETCTICLEKVVEGVQMPCSHVFHDDCIGDWLRIDRRCPLCRFEMPAAMEV